jgi:hypothetical protein
MYVADGCAHPQASQARSSQARWEEEDPLFFGGAIEAGGQPYTLNPQPSTLDPKPSTLDPQPSTLNPKP